MTEGDILINSSGKAVQGGTNPGQSPSRFPFGCSSMLPANPVLARIGILLPLISLFFTPGLGNDVYERTFPAFESPEHLYVIDLENIDNLLWPTLSTLQGIVNRNHPRIYLIYTDHGWNWLNETISPRGITHEEVTDAPSLFVRFRQELEGYVIYDPELPDSINVGTTMAGVLDAILVDPGYAPMMEALGMPLIADLRGRWTENQIGEMYDWAHDTYWEACNHEMLGHLEPDIHHLRDYLVATRTFTFYSESGRTADEQLVRDFLERDDLVKPTPILGYFTEERGFRAASECGAYTVTSNFAPSLTVHSSLEVEFPLSQERPNSNIQLEDRGYITFMISPNSLAYNLDYMLDQWQDPRRGEVPLGWAISPAALELAPAVVNWYYETASDADYFMAPPSGIGSMYPSLFPGLDDYISRSVEILRMLDLTETWLWNFPDPGNKSIAREILEESGLRAVFENAPDSYSVFDDGVYLSTNMVIVSDEPSDEHRIGMILDEIRRRRAGQEGPSFICVYLATFKVTPSLLWEVSNSLGNGYRVVSPIEFIRLLEGPRLELNTLDGSGNPLPACDIVLRDTSGVTLGGWTDVTGRCSLYVDPGEYSVRASWKDVVVWDETLSVGTRTSVNLHCEVFDLTTSFRDILGFPAIGSHVILYSPGGNQLASGKTDNQGQVSFYGLPPGEYFLTINTLGIKTRREISLVETTNTRYGVTISIFTLSILLAISCGVVVILYFSYPRSGTTRLTKPEPTWISHLKLDVEYELVMDEIREKEAIGVEA